MVNFDANFINIENNQIYMVIAIYQPNVSIPLFYKYSKIDIIMKDVAKIIKNIQPTIRNDYNFSIKIIGCYNDEQTAQIIYDNLLIVTPPSISNNDVSTPPARRGRPTQRITCVETGETWDSIADASRSAGIRPQRMVAHLNGYYGYRTIAGRTYRRTTDDKHDTHDA